MNSANGAAVVVGVDGSEPATRAVRLAAREARRRDRPLRVVHGFIWPLLRVPVSPPAGSPPGAGLRHQAEQLVSDAVAVAEAEVPGLHVTGEIIDGEAAAVLLGESPTAAVIVLGDRGLGGFAALVVGSVAVQVSSHADCPVLIARGTARDDGPVVVGVDGSALSRDAVEFAAETAYDRGAALHVVYAHSASRSRDDDEERVLADALTGIGERWPELPVHAEAVREKPLAALTTASRDAQLVVVGRHGRGELSGLLLGSVSQGILHRSACPVAVVRAPG
ncbi:MULTISPECIES: universal stress protein [unclassified Micromonospora]|uniref:universal stress protein n=1 Tax=unclassified Micromonospora TaxID=2617518 RepID=UPI001C24089C|nr:MULTISPECIES: universal stress protein [unclassified Micromonospora]MBU8860984.1 universal stress protein [Micromonospora sp. WMMB482]MDM4780527.1 universal stress protein [Micromonospora sp. b486]